MPIQYTEQPGAGYTIPQLPPGTSINDLTTTAARDAVIAFWISQGATREEINRAFEALKQAVYPVDNPFFSRDNVPSTSPVTPPTTSPTPVGTTTPTPTATPTPLDQDALDALAGERDRRRRTRFEQEGGVNLQPTFQQYLATNPVYRGLSSQGQGALENLYDPIQLGYDISRLNSTPLNPEEGEAPFYSYLRSGARLLTPQEQLTGLQDISNLIGQEGITGQNAQLAEQYRVNPYAAGQYEIPFLQQISPRYRAAGRRVAQNIQNRFEAETPERSFAQYLASRGGFFGG